MKTTATIKPATRDAERTAGLQRRDGSAHRELELVQDMMYCELADLVGPDTVIRNLEQMEGEIRCPDCNARMRRCGLDEYKCQKCGEGWTVTAA